MRRMLNCAFILISLLLVTGPAGAQSVEELLDMANDGIGSAQCLLGFKYLDGDGVAQDTTEAMKWFRMAAENGDAHAAYTLGRVYYKGEGTVVDYNEAFKWFLMAARKSDANSQFRLSEMYLNGDGVDKDVIAAYAWLSLSIGNGANKRGVRDNLERNMTKTQVEEAKGMADSLGASFE
jgi:TPR repeat protein